MAHKALLLMGNGPYLSVCRGEPDQESDPSMMRQMADTVLQLLNALLANLLAKVSGQFQRFDQRLISVLISVLNHVSQTLGHCMFDHVIYKLL